jgi:hypothetical protein
LLAVAVAGAGNAILAVAGLADAVATDRAASADAVGRAVVAVLARLAHAVVVAVDGHADIVDLVTILARARIGAHLAVERNVAGLDTVAEQAVIAVPIIGHIIAGIGAFVARVAGAIDSVVAVDGRPRLAAEQRIAGFGAVAVLSQESVVSLQESSVQPTASSQSMAVPDTQMPPTQSSAPLQYRPSSQSAGTLHPPGVAETSSL